MNPKSITKLLTICITILLVLILFSQIKLSDIVYTLTVLNYFHLLFAFILYSCSYFFRTLRFYILLDKKVSLKDLFHIVCVHNMANNIFPARTGELSYVYLLNKVHNKQTGEGIASLAVARVLDLFIILIMFFISLYFVEFLSSSVSKIIWIAASFMIILIVFFALSLYFGTYISLFTRNIFIGLKIDRINVIIFLLNKVDEVIESIQAIKSFKKTAFLELIIASFGIWLSMYSFNFLLVSAMNIDLDFLSVIFATSFAIFTTVLPIQGVGGFGTLEGGWTVGFVTVGLASDLAISSGFIYHTIIWIYFLILGAWGTLMLKRNEPKEV